MAERELRGATARTVVGTDGIGAILRPAMTAMRPGSAGDVGSAGAFLESAFVDLVVAAPAFIRRRRLERCRLDLANPALVQRSIAAISHAHGVTDGSHFFRLFHSELGCSPREYRHTVVG